MTTRPKENYLIGYDPLAWLEVGDSVPTFEEPLSKKNTKKKTVAIEIVETIETNESGFVDEKQDNFAKIGVDITIDQPETAVEEELVIELLATTLEVDNNSSELNKSIEIEQEEIMPELENQEKEHEEESIEMVLAEPIIDLEPVLSIQHVTKLYQSIKNSLKVHDHIEINASDVTSIDTATLQLLVSVKKNAPSLKKEVSIIYPSSRFLESAHLLGLSNVLEIDHV